MCLHLFVLMMIHSYDSRVKAMELDEKPTEQYSDIGGLGKQIQELREAIVLPMTHAENFKEIGITPPKGKIPCHTINDFLCLVSSMFFFVWWMSRSCAIHSFMLITTIDEL